MSEHLAFHLKHIAEYESEVRRRFRDHVEEEKKVNIKTPYIFVFIFPIDVYIDDKKRGRDLCMDLIRMAPAYMTFKDCDIMETLTAENLISEPLSAEEHMKKELSMHAFMKLRFNRNVTPVSG